MTDLEKLRGMSPEKRADAVYHVGRRFVGDEGTCHDPAAEMQAQFQRADTTVTCPKCGGIGGAVGTMNEGRTEMEWSCDHCGGTGSISIRKDTALKIAEEARASRGRVPAENESRFRRASGWSTRSTRRLDRIPRLGGVR